MPLLSLKKVKKANYDFYEKRTIHESSLSPSVHSIIASEIGETKECEELFSFATRLDLDNYNRNTNEGLHITSLAASWMNIVYGFSGLRSDGDILAFSPHLPSIFNHYSYSILYKGVRIKVDINAERALFVASSPIKVVINGKEVVLEESAFIAEVANAE